MPTKKQLKEQAQREAARVRRNKALKKIIGIGLVAGLRATFAPALVSHSLNKKKNSLVGKSRFNWIQTPAASYVTKGLAAMEIIGDKSPTAPDRTAVPQIFGRLGSGAFAGAVVAKATNQKVIEGAVVGAVAALAGTFGAFFLRRWISSQPGVYDVCVGAAEDVIGLAAGSVIMK